MTDLAQILRDTNPATNGNGRGHHHGETLPFTDLGNAQRLAAAHGDDLRYVHPWARWLCWDGTRWSADDTGEPQRRAKSVALALIAEAAQLSSIDDPQTKHAIRWAATSQSARALRDMLALAQSEPGIPITPDALDTDPWLFNVTNGVVDLRTGEPRPHRRDDLITKLAPVAFDPSATCPVWIAALHLWLDGDIDTIEYIRRAVGYSLAGTNREQVIIILHGPGANGKSSFLRTVLDLLGDYATQAPTSTFLERRGDTIPNDLAALRGARLVSAAETGEGRRLNEALVKQMTGGDRISARFMRGEWFEFTPAFTPWLATNHRPEIRGADAAIWRRVRLVPFTVTIPEGERDLDLPEKLTAELAGILNWAIGGCLAWQHEGLTPPAAVIAATADYRNEQDIVGRFLEDCCVIHADAKATSGELYNRYGYWASANGETDTLSAKAFGQRLTDRGFKAHRDNSGRWRLGIGLAMEHDA